MKTTVNEFDFINAFERMGRGNQFSREGLITLFDYLENMEQECEMEIELDVIALCCEYREGTISEFLSDYGLEDLDELINRTTVLFVDELENWKQFDIDVDGDKRVIIGCF